MVSFEPGKQRGRQASGGGDGGRWCRGCVVFLSCHLEERAASSLCVAAAEGWR